MADMSNSNSFNRKVHLIDWITICKHRKFGGLGVKKAFSMNQAMFMKLTSGYDTYK